MEMLDRCGLNRRLRREAVAEVEGGWMASFAEVVEGLASEDGLADSNGLQGDAEGAERVVTRARVGIAETIYDDAHSLCGSAE